MPPQRDPITVRTARLNNIVLGKGCGIVKKAALSNRRSTILPANTVSPELINALCREGLLDAFVVLYNECDKEALKKRDKNIADFVNKYRAVISATCQMRVNTEDFEVKALIGKGYFGTVHLVKEQQTGDVYAMKKIKKSGVTTGQVREERNIMARRESEWLTSLQYAYQDNENLYLVMEFLPGGDLLGLMSRHGSFDEDMIRFYLAELALALNALHAMGYVHRDVKPENILIDRFGHIKLADFGNAAALDEAGQVTSLSPVGTPDYIAPEQLQTISAAKLSKSVHNVKCDFWSMGIIGYEMMYEVTPFHDKNVHETYSKILSYCDDMSFKEVIEFASERKTSQNYRDLISGLVANPMKRLGFEEIKRHPFFETTKWPLQRTMVPPIIPNVRSDDDISNFDDSVRLNAQHKHPHDASSASVRSSDFSGNNLPFVGYSFVYLDKKVFNEDDDLRQSKLNDKIKELQVKLKAGNNEITALKQNLLLAEENFKLSSNRSQALNSAKDEIRKLQSTIQAKTMELAGCRSQIRTMESAAKIDEEMWEKKESTITEMLRSTRQKFEQAKTASEQRYEKLLAEKKNELASMAHKLEDRETELGVKSEECKFAHEELAEYKKMLQKQKEQLHSEQENFNRSKSQLIDSYERKLSELRAEIREERGSKSRLTMELRDVRSQLDDTRSSTKSCEDVRKASEKSNSEILQRLNLEIANNNQLHTANSELEQKLAEQEKTMDKLQQRLSELERDIKITECVKTLGDSSLNEHGSSYHTASGSLTELSEQGIQQQAEIQALKSREHELLERLEKQQEQIKQLESTLELSKQQPPKPAPRAANHSPSVDDLLERQNQKLENELSSVREKMIIERQAARTANLALWKTEKELEKVQLHMKLKSERLQKVENEREEALRAEKSAREEVRKCEERIQELRNELAISKREVSKEHRMWEKSEEERMKCKSELIEHIAQKHQLEQRVAELSRKQRQLQQKYEALNMENKRLIDDLNNERDRLTASQDTLNSQKTELAHLKENYRMLKQACIVTDSQLTEFEALLEKEQMRNKDQQVVVAGLQKTVRERNEEIARWQKQLQEEQIAHKSVIKKNQALGEECKDLKQNQVDIQKKLVQQQKQLIKSTNDLTIAEDRIELLNTEVASLQKKNTNYEEEIINLKEELARILSELYRRKEEVQSLRTELNEKQSAIDELNIEVDELQDTLNEKQNLYLQREIKSETTIAQHKKLIDYLQLQNEDLSQKKKKTLADKLFGMGSSSGKENVTPSDVEASILYRTLKEELRREKQANKTLQEKLSELQNDGKVTMRSPQVKSPKAMSSQRPVSEMPTQSPPKEDASVKKRYKSQSAADVKPKPVSSKSGSGVQRQHHFEMSWMAPTEGLKYCIACDKVVVNGSSYLRCKECKSASHRKCRNDVKKPCGDESTAEKNADASEVVDNGDCLSLEKAASIEPPRNYIGEQVLEITTDMDALEVNCGYEIDEDTLLLGCNKGLYTYHKATKRLVNIAGFNSVSCVAIARDLAKAIIIGSNGDKLYQCDYRQLESRCQSSTDSHKPALETHAIELPLANRQANERWRLVEISNEAENALDSIAIAVMPTRIVVLKYDLKSHKFKPVRALDTATPVSSILFTKHSAIVSSDKFYEIDLDNYGAEDFIDLADASLTSITNSHPHVAIRISPQEFLLCYSECGVFVDEFGCRSRPYNLNWVYAPTGFMYREPFLYVGHFQSVQILRLHRSYTNELAKQDEKAEGTAPEFQRVYLSHYMPTLLTQGSDNSAYTLSINKKSNVQLIYHLDPYLAFKEKLNISMETITSVGTFVTRDSTSTSDSY